MKRLAISLSFLVFALTGRASDFTLGSWCCPHFGGVYHFHATNSTVGDYVIRYTYSDSAVGGGHVDFNLSVGSDGTGTANYYVGTNNEGNGSQTWSLMILSGPTTDIRGQTTGGYDWVGEVHQSGGESTKEIQLGAPPPKILKAGATVAGNCQNNITLTIGGVNKPLTTLGSGGVGYVGQEDDTGQTYEWKVNGTTVATGTVGTYSLVQAGSPELGYTTYYESVVAAAITCPTPTPTPSPTPTPRPSATPTPAFSPPPNPTPPHPDGPPSPPNTPLPPNQSVNGAGKGVIVENPNDFYEPVRKAIEDAGNGSEPNIGSGGSGEPYEVTDDDRGHVEDLQAKADKFTEKTDTLRTGVKDKLDKFKQMFDQLPKNIGTVSTINWSSATGAFGSQYSDAGVIHLNEWQSQIGLLRELLKWVLYIGFAVMTLRAFGWQH